MPDGMWHCPDCSPKLNSVKGVRMYSAVSEQAARRRAELGDIPKKQTKETMYLVKWAGLGYEFCTWETKEDIGDDSLIDEFHRLNNMESQEPDLTKDDVHAFMDKVKHTSVENAGGIACMPELRSQLYAQTRALQFSKFGSDVPELLCGECGPKTKAMSNAGDESEGVLKEVVEKVTGMSLSVARHEQLRINASLPPLLTGEYDAIIPITAKGLMMNVGEINGSVAFLGYRQFADGSKGPSEVANIIRGVGDKIIAVDGHSTVGKTFKEVILLLKESGKNKFAFMRFLENRYSVCSTELSSVGIQGRYAFDALRNKFASDRQRLLVQRKEDLIEEEALAAAEAANESDESVKEEVDGSESESEGSEGSFEPDSEDEKILRRETGYSIREEDEGDEDDKEVAPTPADGEPPKSTVPADAPTSDSVDGKGDDAGEKPVPDANNGSSPRKETKEVAEAPVVIKQETTRSLALRLLDTDVGYSSDEGGDEDCAFFLDGVDSTFTTQEQAKLESMEDASTKTKKKSPAKSKKKKPTKDDIEDEHADDLLPAKKTEFSGLGNRSKLHAAISLTDRHPVPEDFENFPRPSNKQIEAEKAEADALAKAQETEQADERKSTSPSKPVKRSTVKVEQLSTTNDEIIRVWANAETAAATLQLPLEELKQILKGDYDEDLGDEIGGYRWRFAVAGAEVTAPGGSKSARGSKKAKEALEEFRDKLYDPADPHTYKNGNRLRDYQVDGVNWLASTWYKRQGAILADEMGLGTRVHAFRNLICCSN